MTIETYMLPDWLDTFNVDAMWAFAVYDGDRQVACDESGYATPEAALTAGRARFPSAHEWLHTDGEIIELA